MITGFARWSMLIALVGAIYLLASQVLSAQGQEQPSSPDGVFTITVAPETVTGPVYAEPPALTEAQLEALQRARDATNLPVPIPAADSAPFAAPPSDPQTSFGVAPQSSTDFHLQRWDDLTEIASSERSVVHEPSVGNMGDTVFYTANWYAARSADGGQSFSYVNPRTTFPSLNGGFCCDQVVHYAPAQNMMIWALQYLKDANSGTLKIARAVGPTAIANNTWTSYNFNPQALGFANGNWMDFPNLTVTSNYLYVTSNVFTTAGDTFTGSVLLRISLAQLAAGGNLTGIEARRTNDHAATRCSEGATNTVYCGVLLSNSKLRIYTWPDGASFPSINDLDLDPAKPFTSLNRDGVATSPDGTNWAARADSRILGAWVANGVIGYMWMAKQNPPNFPYPYTILARFNASSLALISQDSIWSSDYAWLYPTASPNAAGHVAGVIYSGGGSTYPTAHYWLVDDVSPNFSPLPVHLAVSSTHGPVENKWGDYLTVRKHKDLPNTWVAGLYYLSGGGSNSNSVGRYAWFGRAREFFAFPSVSTLDATNVSRTTATLHGTVNPNGSNTSALFAYGPTTAYGSSVPASPDPGSGTTPVAVSAGVAGLSCETLYHFRLVATNSGGTTDGADRTFTTAACAAFTDNPLVAGSTVVKADHFEELRLRINELRRRFGLPDFDWTNDNLRGAFVQAVDLRQLREALIAAYDAAKVARPSFTNDPLVPGQTPIRAIHIQELRDAVVNLEAR